MESISVEQLEMMMPKPVKEHHWLKKFAGEWTFEGEARMEPGGPADRFGGTEAVRSIGDLWILAESYNESPEGPSVTNLMLLGYDSGKQRFVGSFASSMAAFLWNYDGELDADEKALILHTEGPTMHPDGGTAEFREVIEFVDDDHRTWTSWMMDEEGQWQEVMKSDYRRKG